MTLRLPVIDELRRIARHRPPTVKASITSTGDGRWRVVVRYKGTKVRDTVHATFKEAVQVAIDVTRKRP